MKGQYENTSVTKTTDYNIQKKALSTMTKEFSFDIVIVGAGPAGSSAAYSAAKNGAKVALLEKENAVAQTVRTSGVTWIDAIKEFNIPDDCYNPIKNYAF
ncbi:MAG: FAD-dependent oxidoreductase, partial [Candidatus Nitrosotenuis sp.]